MQVTWATQGSGYTVNESRLRSQAASTWTPEYYSTKAELVEHYKTEYGLKGWKRAIVRDLSALTGQKEKTLDKRFESRMYDAQGRIKEEKRNKGQYEALGKQLPPKFLKPPAKIKVTFNGYIKISGGKRNSKGKLGKNRGYVRAHFTREISGPRAAAPTWGDIFESYFDNFDENPVSDFQVTGLSIEGA